MPTYLTHAGFRQFRSYFDSVARRKPDDMGWNEWINGRDNLPYEADLSPWLDGLCRITIPGLFTKTGNPVVWEFSPELLENFPDADTSGFPANAQEAINRVYQTAGTLD